MQYSVLMSVYAKENPDYLILSMDSMFKQTVAPDEFVLVCDGPLTPELNAVVERFSQQYPSSFQILRLERNQGLGLALQAGVNACRNNLIARMDSDDIAFPDRCERQLAVFEKDAVDIVGGTVFEFDGVPSNIYARRITPETHGEILRFAAKRNPFNHPSVMFRKETIIAAGNYQDISLFEDYHLWLRVLRNGGQCYNIQEPLVNMRAGESLYARRGGVEYFRKLCCFEREKRRLGFSRGLTGAALFLLRSAVTLAPEWIRRAIYRNMLRSRSHN